MRRYARMLGGPPPGLRFNGTAAATGAAGAAGGVAEGGGGGGATGAGAGGAAGAGGEAMVPSARLREETDRRTAAEQRSASLEGERNAWALERDVMRAGITDPEGIEVASMFYAKVPAGKDKPTIGAWLKGLSPQTAPKALAAYMPQPVAAVAGAAAAAAANTQVAANTTAAGGAGTATAQATGATGAITAAASAQGGGFDASAIDTLRKEAERTGSYDKLKAAMPAIRAQMAARR